MKQYLDLCQRIIDEGTWVENSRTGKRCLTVINADLIYHVDNNEFPLITTRKSFYKAAIAELLGYIRGYDNAADFRKIGCNTHTFFLQPAVHKDFLADFATPYYTHLLTSTPARGTSPFVIL